MMPPEDPQTQKEPSFEAGFHRLEEILEKINSSQISLDQSLQLFEEADRLINTCSRRLNEAERKIEILIKNRTTGDLVLGGDQKPTTQDFPFSQK